MNSKKWIYLIVTICLICCFSALSVSAFKTTANTSCNANGLPSSMNQTGTDQNPESDPAQIQRQEREKLLGDAELLAKGYFYDEAIHKLEAAGELKDEETEAKAAEYRGAKAALQEYTGQIYHVFFHSLIVYPKLAFTGDAMSNGYNMWMTTKDEFMKMLPLFEQEGYILYNIEDLIQKNPNGTISPQKIMLPVGKKPLVISVDDVNYYNYMKNDGFASRLTVNDQGDVVTVVRAPDGTMRETYDGDVIPILDQYVKSHPEFSYKGAKGIIAVTGYQGVYGYRITDLQGEALQEAIKNAKAVSDALKANGWLIANHSYTHNAYFNNGKLTMKELQSDIQRWKQYIEPVTGETNIFISPFGVSFRKENQFFRYIVDQGYTIYCPVGAAMTTQFNTDNMVETRLNLDGYTMISHPERVKKFFFDPKLVLDPERPPLQ